MKNISKPTLLARILPTNPCSPTELYASFNTFSFFARSTPALFYENYFPIPRLTGRYLRYLDSVQREIARSNRSSICSYDASKDKTSDTAIIYCLLFNIKQ